MTEGLGHEPGHPPSVTPAKAGVQRWLKLLNLLDSRLRGNDDCVGKGRQSGRVRDQGHDGAADVEEKSGVVLFVDLFDQPLAGAVVVDGDVEVIALFELGQAEVVADPDVGEPRRDGLLGGHGAEQPFS